MPKEFFVKDTKSDGSTYTLRVCDHDILDEEGAIFFSRELEYLKARSYDVQYPDLKARMLFPVTNAAGPGAEFITYTTYDQAGMSKFIGPNAKDIPRADISGKETIVPVQTHAISAGWTTKEIRAAIRTGKPIQSRKMNAALRATEQTVNITAFEGNDELGLPGLFNNANIPRTNAPNGAGGTPEWITKTPAEILLDLNSTVNDINTDTLLAEAPNTVLLPPEQHAYIATTARSENSDTTILQYFVQNNIHIASVDDVIPCNEVVGAGTAGEDVMVAYDRNPMKAELEIPMELTYLPEQRQGLEIVLIGEASFAGLNVYYPLAFNILEGI